MNTSQNNTKFSLLYTFFNETHETELSMIVDGNNILAFEREGSVLTTRWNLDELVFWLRDFLDNMQEDPFSVQADGEYASFKDLNAREYDSDDNQEFDAYYDKLDEWNLRHRWHPYSSGAILADVYFQLVGDYVEVSWNNKDTEENVFFLNQIGGAKIPKDLFISTVNTFLREYATQWFN